MALMKMLPPEVLQYLSTFIGEAKFRYLAETRHRWRRHHGIERLWLRIDWAAPKAEPMVLERSRHNYPTGPHTTWIKLSRGVVFDPELPANPPTRQVKTVHTILAQYKFILKALSLPHQLFNAHPDGPSDSPMHRYWRVDTDGHWGLNRFIGNQQYVPHYIPI